MANPVFPSDKGSYDDDDITIPLPYYDHYYECKSECMENWLGQVILLVRGAESWRNSGATLCGRASMGCRLLVYNNDSLTMTTTTMSDTAHLVECVCAC